MSSLNIQWTRGKPFGILALLTGFAILTQIPMIYHAQMVIQVLKSGYLPAYIVIIVAAVFIITNAEMVLYEALLIRLRSYDLKDYRAPFLSSSIISILYFVTYFVVFAIANGLELFGLQDPVAQYAICQMISLIIIMVLAFWYNKKQTKVLELL
ncbi:MAG: hypothetical protein ACTSXO_02340 [Candidatus Heimdallarchaeota archaeon]|nr:hypothetical protein [Candidatus Heimdallarchaeota archaeon]RLI69062.1 MAG: hypothetical protein DRO63_01570 [Candidatus Gerdarchaeota archaeon]RLI70607.1 MAG: hypothetical protein DRP02_07270 [Candidatus Gerdarchaeota archaeon]RLI73722.1 MAG: hypothetical protein DRO91_02310 [Candidatus Heimdallarchaeota archaeon]